MYCGIFIILLTLQSSKIEFKFRKFKMKIFQIFSKFIRVVFFCSWGLGMTKTSTFKIAITLRSTSMLFLLQSLSLSLYVKNWCKDCLPRRREASEIKLFPLTPKQWWGGALSFWDNIYTTFTFTISFLSGITFTPLSLSQYHFFRG